MNCMISLRTFDVAGSESDPKKITHSDPQPGMRIPHFFSTDPDPAKLEIYSGSDLKSK